MNRPHTLVCQHGEQAQCSYTFASADGPVQCSAPIFVTDKGLEHEHKFRLAQFTTNVGKVPADYSPPTPAPNPPRPKLLVREMSDAIARRMKQ